MHLFRGFDVFLGPRSGGRSVRPQLDTETRGIQRHQYGPVLCVRVQTSGAVRRRSTISRNCGARRACLMWRPTAASVTDSRRPCWPLLAVLVTVAWRTPRFRAHGSIAMPGPQRRGHEGEKMEGKGAKQHSPSSRADSATCTRACLVCLCRLPECMRRVSY